MHFESLKPILQQKGGAVPVAQQQTAAKTRSPAFFRLSNRHISASLRRFSTQAAASEQDRQTYGFSSLGDLALYAMIGTVLSNPSFTYANGGLQNLLLRHTKNRYFSLHSAIRRLTESGYLLRTRIPEGTNCFHDYYTLAHSLAPMPSDTESAYHNGARCLSHAAGQVFRASYQPYNPPTEDYTEVSIPMLMDPTLSLGAKGLYIVIARYLRLQAYKPDIVLTKDMLRSVCREGFHSFDRMFRELRAAGYLVLTRSRAAKTGYPMYQYSLNKTPDTVLAPASGAHMHDMQNSTETEQDKPTADAAAANSNSAPNSSAKTAASLTTPSAADIRAQIEYGCLVQEYPAERLDCIVSILQTNLSPPKPGMSAGITLGGVSYPREEIASRFSQLDSEDIRYVLDTYNDVVKTTKIRSIRSYLTSCLFHAKENLALALDAFAVRTPGILPV